MRLLQGTICLLAATFAARALCDQPSTRAPVLSERIIEGYPIRVAASRLAHLKDLAAASPSGENKAVIVQKSQRWQPGEPIRVAFRGGSDQARRRIEVVATRWITETHANISLTFRNKSGTYISWRTSDNTYSGDIRVGFASGENGGYWSLVGNESATRSIDGGGPGQASMNLEGFDGKLPADYESIILHEFGHALGFEHEHQSPNLQCGFRFEDDAGYQKVTNEQGVYVPDKRGRRPGVYTYLGGPPNNWEKDKVDSNLLPLDLPDGTLVSRGDPASIMMYYFEPSFFVAGDKSPCSVPQENSSLSLSDVAYLAKAYP